MKAKRKSPFQVEQDYRIFFAFMTLVLTAMYVLTLVENSSLRQSLMVVPFTVLMALHIILHWMVQRETNHQIIGKVCLCCPPPR